MMPNGSYFTDSLSLVLTSAARNDARNVGRNLKTEVDIIMSESGCCAKGTR
jgi:hypothetical protein